MRQNSQPAKPTQGGTAASQTFSVTQKIKILKMEPQQQCTSCKKGIIRLKVSRDDSFLAAIKPC